MSHPKAIAKAFSKYYEQLYVSTISPNKSEKIKQFLQQINITKVDQNSSKAIVETITEEEIKNTIKKLKNNKSPGPDGFPGVYRSTDSGFLKDDIITIVWSRKKPIAD